MGAVDPRADVKPSGRRQKRIRAPHQAIGNQPQPFAKPPFELTKALREGRVIKCGEAMTGAIIHGPGNNVGPARLTKYAMLRGIWLAEVTSSQTSCGLGCTNSRVSTAF